MATYTYYELNADGSVPMFAFADFATEGEARLHAATLLDRRPERAAVEVWSEERLVARVPADERT